ncbi:MAG: hypothetical protein QNJ72_25955 [Pleurocapsa sp. MO_226.B13]|nr:hypothetical protein [Pleurocapsa sp. MO_226.B13]
MEKEAIKKAISKRSAFGGASFFNDKYAIAQLEKEAIKKAISNSSAFGSAPVFNNQEWRSHSPETEAIKKAIAFL